MTDKMKLDEVFIIHESIKFNINVLKKRFPRAYDDLRVLLRNKELELFVPEDEIRFDVSPHREVLLYMGEEDEPPEYAWSLNVGGSGHSGWSEIG